MPYAKIGDELATSDAFLDAIEQCPAAGTALLVANSKAAGELTDGYVKRRWILTAFLGDQNLADAAIAALVSTGLLEPQDDGRWYIADWNDRNQITRAEHEANKKRERTKKAASRAKSRASSLGVSPGDTPQGHPAGTSRPDQTRPRTTTSSSSPGAPAPGPGQDDDDLPVRQGPTPGARGGQPARTEMKRRLEAPGWLPAVLEALGHGSWVTVDRHAIAEVTRRHGASRDTTVAAAREAVRRHALPTTDRSRIKTGDASVALDLRLRDAAPPVAQRPPESEIPVEEAWAEIRRRLTDTPVQWVGDALELVSVVGDTAWIDCTYDDGQRISAGDRASIKREVGQLLGRDITVLHLAERRRPRSTA